jgi:hypothetical protein
MSKTECKNSHGPKEIHVIESEPDAKKSKKMRMKSHIDPCVGYCVTTA